MTPRLPLLAALAALAGCVDDPLRDQPSVGPYERPVLTVPPGAVPVPSDRSEPAADPEAARRLLNPLEPTPEVIQAGQVAYRRYCRHCHGELGRGWTIVGASLDPAPAELAPLLGSRSDGDLFATITFGSRRSPALGPTVTVLDRWRIIHFLRTLPGATAGVPAEWSQ